MTTQKKRLISGIQPSGKVHIGNYFGMMKQLVDLQDTYESFAFIPNYHSLTSLKESKEVKENTNDLILDYLAVGLDPEKISIFKQSDVPQVTELTWIFNCIMTMPWLARAHAYKDKTEKGIEANIGLFDYPILMAADILMYDSEIVPVGKDQKQHVEMAREVAARFNHLFGDTFKIPQEFIKEEVAVVPGTDGQKMSKSYGNTIPLFGTDEEIKKAVMGIVTDSGSDIPTNVYAIHKLFRSEVELAALYAEKKGKYKDLKEALLADIIAFISPMRTRRLQLEKQPEMVTEILRRGGEKARAIAEAKMIDVRKKIGLD